MGGNIAVGLSVLNDVEGVTFNSYGDLDKILQQKANDSGKEIKINPEKLINYRHEKDGLSKNRKTKNPGLQYEIPKLSKNLEKNDVLNHFIKNIGDSITRDPEGSFLDKTTYYPRLSK